MDPLAAYWASGENTARLISDETLNPSALRVRKEQTKNNQILRHSPQTKYS